MAGTPNIPLSEILRSRSSAGDDEPKKKSREDWRKAKELEEARKAGTAPAAVDEDGKDINPHIPQYISSAPWYFGGTSGPTLKHQRPQPEKQQEFSRLDEWYKRGVDTSNIAKKFKPGSCQNCGASTHQKKDCMERPRKIGAAYTGVQIGPDELIQPKLSLDFDGKRDRWAGYDPTMHQAIVQEYSKVEEAKRRLRAERLDKDNEEQEEQEELNDEEDEDKYVDDFDMPGTKVDSKQRITVRNLRIREDTAKYLRNLDPDSAYYDPKTRSMRDNPNPKSNSADADYAGENFVRFTGDTQRHASTQKFAWDAHERGVDVHVLAEPTKLEMLQRVYEEKKEEYKEHVQDSVLAKYGGEEHLKPPPKSLLLAQTEEYVEYSRYGKLIKGDVKPVVRSKYEEDIYPGNHSSVFGSFWQAGQWGYKCCHSFIKNSYCVGESLKNSGKQPEPVAEIESRSETTIPITAAPIDSPSMKKSGSDNNSSSSDMSDSGFVGMDKELAAKIKKKMKKKRLKRKLKKELKKEKRAKKKESFDYQLKTALENEEKSKKNADKMLSLDERKRPYNSMYDVKAPTEAEIEAYYMKRTREDDPMAQFLDK